MAALLHPVKGKRPNCGAVRSNTLLECMEKITDFWLGEMAPLGRRKRPDSFFRRVEATPAEYDAGTTKGKAA